MKYNIIENEFQRSQSSAYQLSILVGMDSLVYAIYDDTANKLLVLKSLEITPVNGERPNPVNAFDEIINKEDLLSLLYRRVKIAFLHSPASLVPERLFNEQEKNTYFEELVSTSISTDPRVDGIGPLKIKAVYLLDKTLASMLKSNFPNALLFSIATPFLTGSHQAIPEGANETAHACFYPDSFQLALFDKGDLLFYNHFKYKSASDVLYFVLLSFEQYALDPAKTPLSLSGQIVNDSDIFNLLYRYIADLTFLPTPSFVRLGKGISSSAPGLFFPLHSLLLCK